MKFFHTGLTVSDLDEAKALFAGLFGMTVTSERELSGDYLSHMLGLDCAMTARIAMLQADADSFLELVEYSSPTLGLPRERTVSDITVSNSPHFAYFVDNLEEFHSRVGPHELQPLAALADTIPGGPFAGGKIRFYRTSFGCLIEVIQRPA
jgi:catechol 2,3-dioxygenase-like lactoylglutathione lyase family enzyme